MEKVATWLKTWVCRLLDKAGIPYTNDSGHCREEVYRNGLMAGMYAMPKDQAEQYCRELTERTDRTHDWHYMGGRVRVLYLPISRRVRRRLAALRVAVFVLLALMAALAVWMGY